VNHPILKPIRPSLAAARATVSGFLTLSLFVSQTGAVELTQEKIQFFKTKVSPILVDHCYKCHSHESDKVKGGLVVDTKSGLLTGGDSGPSVVPGKPDESLLIKAVRYNDENLQMPPKGKKLKADQIEILEKWVAMGAPDPRVTITNSLVQDLGKAREHWAFKPLSSPSLPSVKNRSWPKTDVDRFILSRLETNGLAPAKQADKRTLIRRAAQDLTGLPPTPQEVISFLEDSSPKAYEKLIDRLLASPRYGEKWGRHWLDVARYADTKGYVFEEERRYPYAYTYRDYVIRAFNEDLPYNQFIIEQLAADLLPLGDDKRPLAGLGFLTLGRRFLNNEPDIIDDRIDVVTRGLMGLTVACARCHDHKYDPIPTRDYYSLYGVFSSSHEPKEKPLLGQSSLPPKHAEYVKERLEREERLQSFDQKKQSETLVKLRGQVGDYLLAIAETEGLEVEKSEALVRQRSLDPLMVRKWKAKLNQSGTNDSILGPWKLALSLTNNASPSMLSTKLAAFGKVHPSLETSISTNTIQGLKDLSKIYNELFRSLNPLLEAQAKQTNQSTALAKSDQELVDILTGADGPLILAENEFHTLFDVPSIQEVRKLRRKVEELDATHPGAPPRAMALQDNASPAKPKVFIRGNPSNHGPEVPRQFPLILAGENRQPFSPTNSGRLEMAQAIADPKNPLTARVLVNRVWLNHFGSALVKTPGDFGVRSDPPTHPELLDYLAVYFVSNGWSVKKLHRLIMLSSVYQQGSTDNPDYAAKDPLNDLYFKMNRQRLGFEGMRDSVLAVTGNLDDTFGGHAVDIVTDPNVRRRTVYGFIDRQNLPGMFRTFDFASPDSSTQQRFFTTVPQQALFMMNSPFLIDQSREFLKKQAASEKNPKEKIKALYRWAYQRDPSSEELKMALKFVEKQLEMDLLPDKSRQWSYGYGEYDPNAKLLKSFTKLPHFKGNTWQGGEKLPDEKIGWVTLNAEGGHPGNDLKHAAVRRWESPVSGTIKISFSLKHSSTNGDGVRASIVSSRTGLISEWSVKNDSVKNELTQAVEKGESINFIADPKDGPDSDSFTWAPEIAYTAMEKSSGLELTDLKWEAKANFSGPQPAKKPPLTTWEQFAQILLMSNEMAFVD